MFSSEFFFFLFELRFDHLNSFKKMYSMCQALEIQKWMIKYSSCCHMCLNLRMMSAMIGINKKYSRKAQERIWPQACWSGKRSLSIINHRTEGQAKRERKESKTYRSPKMQENMCIFQDLKGSGQNRVYVGGVQHWAGELSTLFQAVFWKSC